MNRYSHIRLSRFFCSIKTKLAFCHSFCWLYWLKTQLFQHSNSQSTFLHIVICYLLLVVECYLDKFCAVQFAFQPKRRNHPSCCWYGGAPIRSCDNCLFFYGSYNSWSGEIITICHGIMVYPNWFCVRVVLTTCRFFVRFFASVLEHCEWAHPIVDMWTCVRGQSI